LPWPMESFGGLLQPGEIQPAALEVVDSAFDSAEVDDVGQIDDGSSDRCTRNAFDLDGVLSVEWNSDPVDECLGETNYPLAASNRYLGDEVAESVKTMEPRRSPVGRDGAGRASEYLDHETLMIGSD
jgi:hypothetical protein